MREAESVFRILRSVLWLFCMHQGVSVLKDYGCLRTIEGSNGETLNTANREL